eukprot:1159407-Pelagomonas_calceolata.AAC.1
MTARACVVCDPRGMRSFMSDKQLLEHMRTAHGGRGLCDICMAQGNRFPLELEAFAPAVGWAVSSCTSLRIPAAPASRSLSNLRILKAGAVSVHGTEPPQELRKHKAQSHPQCQFCQTHFYGNDELYSHVSGRMTYSYQKKDALLWE